MLGTKYDDLSEAGKELRRLEAAMRAVADDDHAGYVAAKDAYDKARNAAMIKASA